MGATLLICSAKKKKGNRIGVESPTFNKNKDFLDKEISKEIAITNINKAQNDPIEKINEIFSPAKNEKNLSDRRNLANSISRADTEKTKMTLKKIIVSDLQRENSSPRTQEFIDSGPSFLAEEFITENRDNYFSLDDIKYYGYQLRGSNMSKLSLRKNKKIEFKQGEIIGCGSFGNVYKGFNLKSTEIMAIKQVQIKGVNYSDDRIKSLEIEIDVLSELRHKNIVRYIGTSRNSDNFNIFLEYVTGGSLTSLLSKYGPFNEKLIRRYTKQILEGLEYLHTNNVIHRDIKGANVLVEKSGVCKLTDFGSSKKLCSVYETEKFQSIKGTAFWMAPEVIQQRGSIGRFSDIWSLGCTVIEMMTGKPPFSDLKLGLIKTMMYICENEIVIQKSGSSNLKNFIECCLKRVPEERANVRELLNHPFITKKGKKPDIVSETPKVLSIIDEESYTSLHSNRGVLLQRINVNKLKTEDENSSPRLSPNVLSSGSVNNGSNSDKKGKSITSSHQINSVRRKSSVSEIREDLPRVLAPIYNERVLKQAMSLQLGSDVTRADSNLLKGNLGNFEENLKNEKLSSVEEKIFTSIELNRSQPQSSNTSILEKSDQSKSEISNQQNIHSETIKNKKPSNEDQMNNSQSTPIRASTVKALKMVPLLVVTNDLEQSL